MRERNIQIDILRGIAMILIVLGHCGFPLTRFIYLFHLAIFFIISGFCFDNSKIMNYKKLREYIITKIKRLYIPYIIGNIVCVLLNNIFIKMKLYNIDNHYIYNIKDYSTNILKVLLFRGHTEMLGATWFLEILFLISILYAVTEYLINKTGFKYKRIIHFSISIGLFSIGYVLKNLEINILFKVQILTCYWLYDIGRNIREIKISEKLHKRTFQDNNNSSLFCQFMYLK